MNKPFFNQVAIYTILLISLVLALNYVPTRPSILPLHFHVSLFEYNSIWRIGSLTKRTMDNGEKTALLISYGPNRKKNSLQRQKHNGPAKCPGDNGWKIIWPLTGRRENVCFGNKTGATVVCGRCDMEKTSMI